MNVKLYLNKCAVQTKRINFYKQDCKRVPDINLGQHVESDSQYNFASQGKVYHSMKGPCDQNPPLAWSKIPLVEFATKNWKK